MVCQSPVQLSAAVIWRQMYIYSPAGHIARTRAGAETLSKAVCALNFVVVVTPKTSRALDLGLCVRLSCYRRKGDVIGMRSPLATDLEF